VRRIGGARAVGLTDGAAAYRVGGNADPVHVDFDTGQRHLGHADFVVVGRVDALHRVVELGPAAVLVDAAFDPPGVLPEDQLQHRMTA
jgi:hypothetical protein